MYRVAGGTSGGGGTNVTGELRPVGADTCPDVPDSTTTAGTQVEIWSRNGQADQRRTLNSDGTITGVQSGLCLDATGAGTANGTLLQLWTCNGSSNQK